MAHGKTGCLRSLGVRYVLGGAVGRDQSRVSVNAQFVDAELSRRPLQLAGRRVRLLPGLFLANGSSPPF